MSTSPPRPSTHPAGGVRISRYTHPRRRGAGLAAALALLAGLAAGHVLVQTQLRRQPVFLPLYATPKARHVVSSSSSSSSSADLGPLRVRAGAADDVVADERAVAEKLLAQLYARLAVDETVSAVVGVPVARPAAFADLDLRVVAKRYWLVGLQFLPPDEHENGNDGKYALVYRKQARVLRTDSLGAFARSVFGGTPPAAGDGESAGAGDARELNAIIQLEGDAPQDVGEAGPAPGRGRRRAGDEHGDEKDDGKRRLEDLVAREDQVQLVACGAVTVRGPGGLLGHAPAKDSSSATPPPPSLRAELGLEPLSEAAVTEARVEFVATKTVVPDEVGVRFVYTVLVYRDPRTGQLVRQRLW